MNYLLRSRPLANHYIYPDVTINLGSFARNRYVDALDYQLLVLKRELNHAFDKAKEIFGTYYSPISIFNELIDGEILEVRNKVDNCETYISGDFATRLIKIRNMILANELNEAYLCDVSEILDTYVDITRDKYQKELPNKIDQASRIATWVREALADLELTLKVNDLISESNDSFRANIEEQLMLFYFNEVTYPQNNNRFLPVDSTDFENRISSEGLTFCG